MLSTAFKKTLKDTLKSEYDIDCHRISPFPDYGYKYREATLHCSHLNEKFTLTLMFDVSKGVYTNVVGQFEVFLPERFVSSISSVNTKINLDLINASVNEVRKEMVQLLSCFSFHFGSLKVSLIKGTYVKDSEFFEIKKITPFINTNSFMTFYTSLDDGKKCCDVQIIGNEIIIKPVAGYDDEPIFKQSSIIAVGELDVFKANLVKSVLFYLQDHYRNQDDFKVDVEGLLPLTYEQLLKEFLVEQMTRI